MIFLSYHCTQCIYSLLNTIQDNSVYCLFGKNSLDWETCYLKHMPTFSDGINTQWTAGLHCHHWAALLLSSVKSHTSYVITSAFKQIVIKHQLWGGNNDNKHHCNFCAVWTYFYSKPSSRLLDVSQRSSSYDPCSHWDQWRLLSILIVTGFGPNPTYTSKKTVQKNP